MKTLLAFLAILALVLGGCASAPKGHTELMERTMKQTVQGNEIKLTKACTDAHNKAVESATYTAVSRGFRSTDYMQFYNEPPCVARERAKHRVSEQEARDERPVILPENIGIRMQEAANMDRDKICENMVARAIAAKGVAAVLGDRSVYNNTVRYDQASNECVVVAAVKEYRRFRLNDVFRSYPWNGYTSDYLGRYPYAAGSVPVGVEIGIDTGGWSPYGRKGSYPNDPWWTGPHPRIQEHYRNR